MGQLTLSGVTKNFGPVEVIKGVDLKVADGEFCVFVGPSGCGKSTLLRMIAGLEDVSGGTVTLDGREITNLPPARREIAMVFQSYALYPHLTVRDNMGLALKQAGHPKGDIRAATDRAATMLSLDALLDRRPAELSGGQRQRVAIGRAIVRRPKLFLFDEPLSNLDAALRVQTRIEIAKLHRDLGATMVYVTHDQNEAMAVADTVGVMDGGRLEQVGTPAGLFDRPATPMVARFIGQGRTLPVEVTGRTADGLCAVRIGAATLSLPGLSTFVSEFLVIAGSWSTQPVATAFAVWGVVLAAIYVLLMYKRIFTGPPPVVDPEGAGTDRGEGEAPATAELPYVRADLDEGVTPARLTAPLRDLGWREKAVVAPVVIALVVLGFFPGPVLDTLDPAVERTLQIVGVSDPAPSVPADAGSTSGSDH